MRGSFSQFVLKTNPTTQAQMVGQGDAKPTGDLDQKRVQIVCSGASPGPAWNGTMVLEGTIDGTTWETVTGGGAITTTSVINVPLWYAKMRVNITVYTAGSAAGGVGGIDLLAN